MDSGRHWVSFGWVIIFFSFDLVCWILFRADGVMFQWRIKDAWRPQEFVQKGVAFSSAIIAADSHVFVVGSDRVFKVQFCFCFATDFHRLSKKYLNQLLSKKSILVLWWLSCSFQIHQNACFSLVAHFFFSSSCVWLKNRVGDRSNSCIFISLIGRLEWYACTLTWHFPSGTFYYVLFSPLTPFQRLVPDDSLLATVGDDGCLFLFDIKEREPRIAKRSHLDYIFFSSLIFFAAKTLLFLGQRKSLLLKVTWMKNIKWLLISNPRYFELKSNRIQSELFPIARRAYFAKRLWKSSQGDRVSRTNQRGPK